MKRIKLIYISILFCFIATGQENRKFVIKGKVTNISTNSPLSNVNLTCNETGTITNKNGIYRLRLDVDKPVIIQIIASHQGYKNDTTLSLQTEYLYTFHFHFH